MAFAFAVCGQSGQITGKLVYPGDGIPRDLVLCITSSEPETTLCSNFKASTLTAARMVFKIDRRKATYQVTLPPGNYHIFAKTGEMPGHRAFYNEYVKCGMEYTCRSKKPIILAVRNGKIIKGVSVGDFWNVT